MRRPDFFIVGAPKCGTSSLAYWLDQHPNVYFSPEKEPHHFSSDIFATVVDRADYERLFDAAEPHHLAVGEGSSHYLHSPTAVPSILDYRPDARFIVCLRDPVDMAPSVHSERVFSGMETVTDFAEAWRLQDERNAGNQVPLNARHQPLLVCYRSFCELGARVEKLLTTVGRDRVLFVLLDDLRDDPGDTYRRTLNFLGVDPDFEAEFERVNSRKAVQSVRAASAIRYATTLKRKFGVQRRFGIGSFLLELNSERGVEAAVVNPQLRAEMRTHYRDDVDQLERLIDRDLSAWRVDAPHGSDSSDPQS